MESLYPKSFVQVLAGVLAILAIVLVILSLFPRIRNHSTRLFAITIVASLTLFANHWATYFAGVFIIATAVTELEFLQNLAAIIRGFKPYFEHKTALATQGKIHPSEAIPLSPPPTIQVDPLSSIHGHHAEKPKLRTAFEYKILQTLWTKQVSKFPDFSKVFTFRINANSPEFIEYHKASTELIKENLISETVDGQAHLTSVGWEYCKEHYEDFPPDQWWPSDSMNEENLRKVLGKT